MKKVFAILTLVIVFATVLIFPLQSFAAESSKYNNISLTFNNFGSTTTFVAFPGAHSVELFVDGVLVNSVLSDSLFLNDENTRVLFGDLFGTGVVPYIQIRATSHYSAINLNGNVYYGTINVNDSVFSQAINTNNLTFYPLVQSGGENLYYYTWNVVLTTYINSAEYEQALKDAYDAGAKDGALAGYEQGRKTTESANFGLNLIGDTLKAPMDALNQFVLFRYNHPVQGVLVPMTLGDIVGGVIAFSVFLAVLKMFAGG